MQGVLLCYNHMMYGPSRDGKWAVPGLTRVWSCCSGHDPSQFWDLPCRRLPGAWPAGTSRRTRAVFGPDYAGSFFF